MQIGDSRGNVLLLACIPCWLPKQLLSILPLTKPQQHQTAWINTKLHVTGQYYLIVMLVTNNYPALGWLLAAVTNRHCRVLTLSHSWPQVLQGVVSSHAHHMRSLTNFTASSSPHQVPWVAATR